MSTSPRTSILAALLLLAACTDDGVVEAATEPSETSDSAGDGDGDPAGDGDGDASGDGDGEASGDGDGDASGDGDGDASGDGDGDATGDGDGDGDVTGDGDGDATGDGDGDGDATGDGDGDMGDGDGDMGDGDGDPFECEVVDPPNPPAPCADAGILLADEFEPWYTCLDLGNLPGIPSNWGGLTISDSDPNILLIGGSANTANGQLYAVEITRDVDCHVTGWAGTPIESVGEAAYIDGGLVYGQDGVLFLSRYPNNELGQQLPGSVATDKIIDLGPLGVAASVGGLNVVPPGFGGEGQLKLVSWSGGQWYTLSIEPDGDGTFDVTSATMHTQIVGGPEGFVHLSGDNPGLMGESILVSEWSAGNLAVYDADQNGDPVTETRRDFLVGLTGAEGAYLDDLSGDFLFTTFGGGNRLVAIRGFLPNPQ